jgi:hypothetical protein
MRRLWVGFALTLALAAGGCDEGGETPIASAAGRPSATAAPSGGAASPGPGPTDPRVAGQAFVGCMRDRGEEIVDPPDPDDPRSAIRHELDVNRKGSNMRFQASLEACIPLLPPPPPPSREQTKEDIAVNEALRSYSRCVQANGVPNFPDLSADSEPGAGPVPRESGGRQSGARQWRTDPVPTVPPATERKCADQLRKLDAAQEDAARAGLKRK